MSCLIDIDHGDNEYEIVSDKMITAKRNFKCCECQDIIPAGQRHEYFAGRTDDGRMDKYHTCMVCRSIRMKFVCDWIYSELFESISDGIEYAADNDYDPDDIENCILIQCTQAEFKKLNDYKVFGDTECLK